MNASAFPPAPMPSATFISYEVVTAAGRPIRTFDERKAAEAFAVESAPTYPGLKVERVIRRPEARITVWTASKLQLVRTP